MPVNPPATSQPFGRTFIVAAAVLGLVALVQLSAVTVAFFSKRGPGLPGGFSSPGAVASGQDDERPHPAPAKIDVSNLPGGESADPVLDVGNDPIAEARPAGAHPVPGPVEPAKGESPVAVPENPQPATSASTVPLAPPRPTPVPLSALTPKQNPRFVEIVEQGKLLRSSGDTAGALLRFREAALLEPGNPLPLAETAYTFEKMSLPDKAAEQWRQVLAMGESAGVYYSAAQAKLSAAINEMARTVAVKQPMAAASSIPDGKMLAVSTPRVEDQPNGISAKRFTLHVPIRAKAGQAISVRDMKVFVLFFEKLNGKDIVRTTANVSNSWENPPIDWAEGEETLDVTYDLPPNDGRGEPREYHGYIIRLYYQGELQDTQAVPPNLNQRFPAEYQLPE